MSTSFFLLFGCMMLAFAAFTYFMYSKLVFSGYLDDKKCTEKTEGKIIRYSNVLYNDVSLPVVEYTVDGNQYKVVGPRFLSSVSKTFATPLNSVVSEVKLEGFDNGEIPQVLRYQVRRNSFISVTKSPLMERFPIGGKVTVYYDPNKPKLSYVERPLKPGRFLWLRKISIYLLILMMLASAVFIMFILPNLVK
ncbi:DUF3592 domain-containing protein [Streptococcus sp. Marseille-P6264]|uniref:DUF3592 domain-containing protein n=1 Tax=Streptococcus sp. Marseille-P6264 TaxID=2487315 RepID=UPI0011E88569|nr:DUF3592 domain-containing protein [Streptococcus sp. Marseille-P6264]